jgi:hypothetical protein
MNMKHYADGKARPSKLDSIKERERIDGTAVMSPYGTSSLPVLMDKLDNMEIEQMKDFAFKCGVKVIANQAIQREHIITAFKAWQTQNPPPARQGHTQRIDRRTNKSKEILADLDVARTKSIWERDFATETPQSFRKLLNTYSLADLQNLSARAGFNPSFDRGRIIGLLVSELEKDINLRP